MNKTSHIFTISLSILIFGEMLLFVAFKSDMKLMFYLGVSFAVLVFVIFYLGINRCRKWKN